MHTGVWKSPVAGPVLARRGNLDGDGQGDLNGHGGEQRAVLVYQIESYRHWQQHFGPTTMTTASASSARTSPSTACPTTRCASATGTASARPSSRSPSPGSPATGSACASASPNCPRCWSATTAPGSTCGSSGKGTSRRATRSSRPPTGPHALTVADTDALLYLPHRDQAKLQDAVQIPALSPGWQQSFRDLLAAAEGPAQAARHRSAPSRAASPPAWAGFRALRVDRVVPESTTVSSIYLAATDGGALPPAQAGQYLTLRVSAAGQPAPVRSYSLSSPPDGGRYRISVKHEPHGTASSYLNRPAAPGRAAGRGRAARRLHPRRRHRPGPAHLGRHRGDPGAVHAAPAGRATQRARDVVAARGAQPAGTSVRGRGARPARRSPACPRARLLQSGPRYPTPVPGHGRPAVQRHAGRSGPAGRTRLPTSVARTRS